MFCSFWEFFYKHLLLRMNRLNDLDAADGVVFGVAFHLDLGGDAFFEHLDVADDADAAAAHLVEAVERFHHVVEVAGAQ